MWAVNVKEVLDSTALRCIWPDRHGRDAKQYAKLLALGATTNEGGEFNENEGTAVSGFVMVSETCSEGKTYLYPGALSMTELI